MARFIRPQFSLATLLLAMAWSAVMVYVNTNTPPATDLQAYQVHYYGWPWVYGSSFLRPPRGAQRMPMLDEEWFGLSIESRDALFKDAAVSVLLVIVLTWGSNQLLRRVGERLRRRTAEESKS